MRAIDVREKRGTGGRREKGEGERERGKREKEEGEQKEEEERMRDGRKERGGGGNRETCCDSLISRSVHSRLWYMKNIKRSKNVLTICLPSSKYY